MKYLVLVPVYNEETSIASVVEGALKVSPDVVVVDDGSTDLTAKVLSGLPVKVIRQEHVGKGAALKTGFDYALKHGYDWVITLDGDGQHATEEIPGFVGALNRNGTDMVVGSRMDDTANMPFVRLVTNKVMSRVISFLSGVDLPDSQCGFRAISSRLLKGVELETNNYETESEIIIKAARKSFRITSIPISTIYTNRGSSINKFTDTVRVLRLFFRLLKDG